MKDVKILQTGLFKKQKKKLNKNQITDLDKAILKILENPLVGQHKKGDLSQVWVYKFSMVNVQNLLAYSWNEKTRKIIAIGVHENFYRDLKKAHHF